MRAHGVNYTERIETCRCPVSSEQRSDCKPAVSDAWPHDKPTARLPTGRKTQAQAPENECLLRLHKSKLTFEHTFDNG